MFRTVPLSINRSFFSLYAQQWCVSYRFAEACEQEQMLLLTSCQQTRMTHTIAVRTVKKTPVDGLRNCPKHVDFHSKNKFEKLVYLVGFTLRNLSRCTVTSTSKTKHWFRKKSRTHFSSKNSVKIWSLWAGAFAPAHKLPANLYDTHHCCAYSEKTPVDGQRNCPKHVDFHSKNKFEKLVHLVGFILRNIVSFF